MSRINYHDNVAEKEGMESCFDSGAERTNLKNYYYDIFMSRYEIENADYQESNFILRKFWADGRLSAFKLNNTDAIGGKVAFAKFNTSGEYNHMDFPIKATPISDNANGNFPTSPLLVDEKIVIGYARHNQKPIKTYIDNVIEKMVEIEKAISRNVYAVSIPVCAGSNSTNMEKMNTFFNRLNGDTKKLVFEFTDDMEKPYLLWDNVPYNIDRLYNQLKAYDSDILTYLGINNLGGSEKKEHLITSEINVNNEVIQCESDNFVKNISSFLKRVNALFATQYRLKVNRPVIATSPNKTEGNPDKEEEEEDV